MCSLKAVFAVIVIGGGMFEFGGAANVFSNPVALRGLFEIDAQIAGAIRTVLENNEIEASRMDVVKG